MGTDAGAGVAESGKAREKRNILFRLDYGKPSTLARAVDSTFSGVGPIIKRHARRAQKKKKRVPVKLRREVLATGKCNYCGSKENLQIDHIIPYSKGGANHRDNLQCLCGSCNSKKSDRIIHDHLKRILPKSADHSS